MDKAGSTVLTLTAPPSRSAGTVGHHHEVHDSIATPIRGGIAILELSVGPPVDLVVGSR